MNRPTYTDQDIAIVGMAGIFPGAPNADVFWHNIIHKVDAITDPPREAWEVEVFYDPNSDANDRVYCKKGGFIGSLATFNPLQHGIMPKQLAGTEPDQWLALELARLALEDAGYRGDFPERHRTAVLIGRGTYLNRGNTTHFQHGTFVEQIVQIVKRLNPGYSEDDLQLVRRELKQALPPFNTDTAPGLIPNIIAGRIANKLDLMGPAYTVDGACASSLLALEQAIMGLQHKQFDLALVGGAQVVTPVPVAMLFCQLNALSRAEKIRPFDDNADGTVLGEGIGMVLLKSMPQALADGNRIYAVIRGVGTSSDGRGMGVMAPRLEGEVLAMRRAYASSGIDPATIGLVEAHGTATHVGDATEIEALRAIFGDAPPGQPPAVAIGTVKSMIGHTIPASGVAGLIKISHALYHKILPPTLNVEQPHRALTGGNLYVNTEARPWVHGSVDTPRRAGVNAFGFGGINAHVILEEFPVADETQLESHLHRWETELFLVSADSRAALTQQARDLAALAPQVGHIPLKDLAYSLNVEQSRRAHLLAVVASDHTDLARKLERAVELLQKPGKSQIKDSRGGIYYFEERLAQQGKLAFLFPGEGSQYVNMLADLCFHFPEIRAAFDRIDRIFQEQSRDYKPSDVIFPRPAFSKEESKAAEERLFKMKGAIEAVLTSNYALFLLLARLGIQPDAILGHSTGEYSALLASGMVQLDNPEKISLFTAELNDIYDRVAQDEGIPQATLLACAASADRLWSFLSDLPDVYIGMDNCPHQSVVIGKAEAMEEAIQRLTANGIIFEKLGFDRPYHTPLFTPFESGAAQFLEKWLTNPPRYKTYSCTSVGPFPDTLEEARAVAVRHWVDTVHFQDTIQKLYDDGVRLFVEVGPRGNLTAFVSDILGRQNHLAGALNLASRSSITQLNHLLGMLAAHGVKMDLRYLYARRAPQAIDLAHPPAPEKGRMKLETGWPLLNLPEETARHLQLAHAVPATSGQNGFETKPAPPTPTAAVETGPRARPTATEPPTHPAPASVAPTRHERPAESRPTLAPLPAPAAPAVVGTGLSSAPAAFAPASAPAAPGRRQSHATAQVMAAYMQTMEQFLAGQEQVMHAFLTGSAPAQPVGATPQLAAPPQPTPTTPQPSTPWQAAVQPGAPPTLPPLPSVVRPAPAGAVLPPAPPVAHQPAPPPTPIERQDPVASPPPATLAIPVAAPTPVMTRGRLQAILLEIVSERTGYPAEMLDLDVDLEADLGIDSIKKVEVLGQFQKQFDRALPAEQMEALTSLKTLRQIVDFIADVGEKGEAAPTPPTAAPAAIDYPFIRNIIQHKPGELLEALCPLNMAEDILLEDHTLGRNIAFTDPTLTGLPVMPLTGTVEMLAEAAAVLAPGRTLVRFDDILAYRWIALDEGQQQMRLLARRQDNRRKAEDELAIHVMLWEGDIRAPIAEATVIFADAYRPAPPATLLQLNDRRPSSWPGERLYEESLMFHGARFRGVASMDVWSDNGASGTLVILPTDELFASTPRPNFVVDPVLLDQVGQVVGFWGLEYLPDGVVMFPYRVEELHVYSPTPTVGTRLTCNGQMELFGDNRVRAFLEVVQPDGQVWLKLKSWEDRRFELPPTFFRFVFASPRERVLSHPWTPPAADDQIVGRQLSLSDFPDDFFSSASRIWLRVLVFATLGARERAMWRALKLPADKQLEWLLARVVAKDAVREYLKATYDLLLCPADVEIIPDEQGKPIPRGPWEAQVAHVPALSIAHAGGRMVALVHPSAHGVGCDVEPAGAFPADGVAFAFTPDELALVATLPADGDWQMRFWCAKEAVGKALGHGLAGRPKGVVVHSADSATGVVTVGLAVDTAAQINRDSTFTLRAHTSREADMIVAVALDMNHDHIDGTPATGRLSP